MEDIQIVERRRILDDLEVRGLCWPDPSLYFEDVKKGLPKGIEILQAPQGRVWQYNCFSFALGLHVYPEFYKTSKDGYVYSPFVDKLFQEGRLVPFPVEKNPSTGHIVMYKFGGEFKHGGVVDKDKVISKWSGGPLLRHDILDVPTRYGDEFLYFFPIPQEQIFDLYQQYKAFNFPPSPRV